VRKAADQIESARHQPPQEARANVQVELLLGPGGQRGQIAEPAHDQERHSRRGQDQATQQPLDDDELDEEVLFAGP
jgi:hypothetical protein